MVPSSTVNANDLAIYELDEFDGSIKKLPDYQGLPSDENTLNCNLEDETGFILRVSDVLKIG